MSNAVFTAEQLDLIAGSAKEQRQAARELEAAKTKAAGAYTGTLMVAAGMGAEDFDSAMEDLFGRVKRDGKLARRFGAEKAKDGEGWQVPGNLRTARSVIKGAFEYHVALLDDDGETPRSFGAIRKDLKAAKDLEAELERTDEQVLRDDCATTLRELAESLGTGEVDAEQADRISVLLSQLAEWKAEYAAISGETEAEERAAA